MWDRAVNATLWRCGNEGRWCWRRDAVLNWVVGQHCRALGVRLRI